MCLLNFLDVFSLIRVELYRDLFRPHTVPFGTVPLKSGSSLSPYGILFISVPFGTFIAR
jgi:hypothetical protein